MKIAINLLPEEFKVAELKRAKFYQIHNMGVAIIVLVVFLSSLTVALRILQSHNLKQIQNKVSAAEQKITDLKDVQGSLLLLKNRLTAINQYLGNPSKQVQMYNLVAELLPESISVSSISVGGSGEILVVGVAKDGASLDKAITDLTLSEESRNKIGQVALDSISRGREGIYRLTFKIKPR